jgi:hypothetical protein
LTAFVVIVVQSVTLKVKLNLRIAALAVQFSQLNSKPTSE